MLKRGAENILATKPGESSELIDSLYQQTICRPPGPAERQLALQLVGSPAKASGVEDLLWVLAMLPEFQLIR
jgi:hypothetical protein